MPATVLNKINLTKFFAFAGLGFILMEFVNEVVLDLAEEDKAPIRYAYALTVVSSYILLSGLKFHQHQTDIFNSRTFYNKRPISKIKTEHLLILDHCAFDITELVLYAENDFSKIYKNPHKKTEFSAGAKKLIKANASLYSYAWRLEKHLSEQKRSISDTVINKLITMLEKINAEIDNNVPDVIDLIDDDASDSAEQLALQHIILNHAHADQALDDDDVEDNEIVWDAGTQSENVSVGADAAYIEFSQYLDTLSRKQRNVVNDYIIEVPVLGGDNEFQRLKFKDALAGGTDFQRCITTVQIFLWQMVVTHRPGLLKNVPFAVMEEAHKTKLDIRPLTATPHLLGHTLKTWTTFSGQFFAAASLRSPAREDDKPLVQLRRS